MKKTHFFFVNHLDHRISNPINNVNNIPICLHIIRHEPLENGRIQPFLLNNYVKLPPHNECNELLCPWIACHKLQSSWPYNRSSHKCDMPWLSILEHALHHRTSSTHFGDHHMVPPIKLDQIWMQLHQRTSWTNKPSAQPIDQENAYLEYSCN